MVDGKKTNEELFAMWLSQNVPSSRLPELYRCYSEIDTYCLKTRVLCKPLLETTDLDTVKRAQKTVTESRIFKLLHRKQMKNIVAAAQYYKTFVKTLSDDANATDASTNAPAVSLEKKIGEIVPEKESSPNEKVNDSHKMRVDFLNINSLAYTEPISFAYFEDEHTDISSWAQLYVNVLVCLWEDYPDEFLRMRNTNISGGCRIDFGTQKASEEMQAPEKVSDNFYVETNLNAAEIVTKLRILLDRCNVDYENLEIYYLTKREQTQQVEAASIENAPVSPKPDMQPVAPTVIAADDGDDNELLAFDAFFEDKKYEALYKELKNDGISSLDKLRDINLWSFMNLHQLYSIQQRLAISTELTAKLRRAGKEDTDSSAYEIHYNGAIYNGASPSEAFAAFLTAVAARYPLKFRTLLNVYNPETNNIVISLHDYYNKRLKLINPEAYVDSDLSSEQVKLYIAWVIERCGATPQEYSVKENQKELETPAETPLKVHEQPEETFAATLDIALTKEAEDYLLQCDLNGATYGELQSKLGYTMVGTKEIVARSPHIIEMNRKLYHEDALVDLEEGAETLDEILDKLLKKNNGIATAKHLYEYARSEMAMFFNDNDITDQQSVYDLARYLFEKLKYHGKRYVFKSNMYISLPDVSADSVIDIVKKYAIEKGSTVTFKEIESYMTGLGANTGNLRMSMRIDKEPVFLIYAENEYLLAELMHIDAAFLESIRSALKRLFEDNDGHIIPRNISDSWYGLLPALPSCLPWTPMLLQQLIRFYPNELDARTIIAMASQSSNTLNAIFVEKESWIHDFRDVVAVFLHDEMPNRSEFEAEELRGILVDAGMISGNELICNMHNALGSDPRFLWNSDGSHVKVRI